jgi:hypothetical protein
MQPGFGMRGFSLLCLCLFFAGCAAPIRSTVDGYGESPLAKSTPLYFDREALPLPERPVSDACAAAAREEGISVSDRFCPVCKRVVVRSHLGGVSQVVTTAPGFGTSVGVIGGATAFGLGFGGGRPESHGESERVIEIGIDEGEGKNPLRTLTVRSLGPENSVSAVAREMCLAAFQDYPRNLRGKVYEVKPGAEAETSD